jgi:metal-responsive CopG/Arc/MetJ family transcriptional regulator
MAKQDKDYIRKHSPISIQLTDPQKDALDAIVEAGKFNGRSHAIREMCMSYIKAIEETQRTGKVYKGTWEFFKGVMAFNERLEIIKNANDEQLDLKGMAELLDEVEVNT